MIRFTAPIAAAFLAFACAPGPAPAPPPAAADFTITLERQRCFGACPDYVVEIDEQGVVRYTGRAFVEAVGPRGRQVSPAEARALYDRFIASDFFALNPEYAAQVTDMPTYILTLRDGSRTHRVRDYAGRMMGMPEIVTELENAVDRTANTREWTGRVPPQD
ncbi:MAG: DUF6438 domain-containing protein [Hyphomonadaceae bacterium]